MNLFETILSKRLEEEEREEEERNKKHEITIGDKIFWRYPEGLTIYEHWVVEIFKDFDLYRFSEQKNFKGLTVLVNIQEIEILLLIAKEEKEDADKKDKSLVI